jgi:hypothetical protein
VDLVRHPRLAVDQRVAEVVRVEASGAVLDLGPREPGVLPRVRRDARERLHLAERGEPRPRAPARARPPALQGERDPHVVEEEQVQDDVDDRVVAHVGEADDPLEARDLLRGLRLTLPTAHDRHQRGERGALQLGPLDPLEDGAEPPEGRLAGGDEGDHPRDRGPQRAEHPELQHEARDPQRAERARDGSQGGAREEERERDRHEDLRREDERATARELRVSGRADGQLGRRLAPQRERLLCAAPALGPTREDGQILEQVGLRNQLPRSRLPLPHDRHGRHAEQPARERVL